MHYNVHFNLFKICIFMLKYAFLIMNHYCSTYQQKKFNK